jgi:hypothetical protein
LLGALRWALIVLLISPLVAAFAKTVGHRRNAPVQTAAPRPHEPHALVLAEPEWHAPKRPTPRVVHHVTHAQPVVRHVRRRVHHVAPVAAAAPKPVAQLVSLPVQPRHVVTEPAVQHVHHTAKPKPAATAQPKPKPKPPAKPAPKPTPAPTPTPTPTPTPAPAPTPAAPAPAPTPAAAPTTPTTTETPVVTAPPPATTPPSTPTTPATPPPVEATPAADTRPGWGKGDPNHSHTGPPGQNK